MSTAKQLQPLYDRIVVKVGEADEVTKGGLILPDNAKEKPQQGVVLAVGNGRLAQDGSLHELTVKEGDIVVFGKYTGTEFAYNGEKYYMMKENDLFAIVRPTLVADVVTGEVGQVLSSDPL